MAINNNGAIKTPWCWKREMPLVSSRLRQSSFERRKLMSRFCWITNTRRLAQNASPSLPLIFGMHTCDWWIVLMVCAHIWFHALVSRYHKAPRVWGVKEQQPSATRVLHMHYFNGEMRICRLRGKVCDFSWKKTNKKKQKTPVSMAMSLKINFSLHVRVIRYLVFFFTFIRERYSIIP